MSSRGSKSLNGHVTTTEYHQVGDKIYDAKILVGNSSKEHSLPDFSHTPNSKYIKINKDGSFREMRVYGKDGFPLYEIGFHRERNISDDKGKSILHYHMIDRELNRTIAKILKEDNEIYIKNKKYLEEFGL